jgi:hypothetical protein
LKAAGRLKPLQRLHEVPLRGLWAFVWAGTLVHDRLAVYVPVAQTGASRSAGGRWHFGFTWGHMQTTVSENAVPLGLTAFWLGLALLFIVGIALVLLPARTRPARKLQVVAGVLLLTISSLATVQNLRALGSMDRTMAPLPIDDPE